MSNQAWVTLATNDSYCLGAMVLAHSLRRAGSAYPAVVLITPSVTDAMRDRLRAVFAEVVTVDVLDSRDAAHLALLQRPELGITFTKIHCWSLTQYEKCVFLDADTLVVQNCDELFEREELSAAPDVGWPDCFNSGVFVFTPSAETFDRLIRFAQERGSFDGGDQGLLNSFFSDWAHGDINKHLPFLYNVTSAAFYSYLPALKHYGQNLKIIHFIGLAKPWLQQFNWESRTVDAPEHLQGLLQFWWDLFVSQVHSQLDVSMVEVQEPHHEITDIPPELPPHDVSQQFHYQPILDPQSEFPWHHPDSQIQDDNLEPHVDMSEFHDPWDIYRGHIPPISDDALSHRSDGKREGREDLRSYVWEYQAHDHTSDNILQSQDASTNQMHPQSCEYSNRDSYQDSTRMCNRNNHEVHITDHHWQHEFHHDQTQGEQSCRSYHAQSNEPQDVYSYHDHTPQHWHHEQTYPEYPQQCHSQKNSAQNHHQQIRSQNRQQEDHSFQPDTINDQHNQKEIHDHNQQNLNARQHQYSHNSHNTHFENLQTVYTFHSHVDSSHNEQYDPQNSVIEPKQHDKQTDECTETRPDNYEQHVPTTSKNQEIETNHVHVEKDTTCTSPSKRHDHLDTEKTDAPLNGNASDTDSEYEETRPRHPYDGFYLRHRSTIDSRGRKICTHEIPPTPSPSPPLSPELQDYFSADDVPLSDCEDQVSSSDKRQGSQSGVAGNFARVVLGSGGQSEAIDDLTRRQGWEAGNIDYMGVDSFENIWAKISQTLSQPRSSPPKQSPPREIVAQPAPEQVEVQTGEVVLEPVVVPVEVAKEAIPIESPTLAGVVAPVEVPVSVEASAPVEVPAPDDAPAPKAAPSQVEIPKLIEALVAPSEELAALTEASVITKSVAPVEAVAQSEVVGTEPSALIVSALATDVPAPVEVSAVTETAIEAPAKEVPVAAAAVEVEAPIIESASIALKATAELEKSDTPVMPAAPVSETAAIEPAVQSPKVVKLTQVAPPAAAIEVPAEVTAEKPAPKVTPEKPVPDVVAVMPAPKVTPEKPAPEVAAEKPVPKVTAEKPAPEVATEKPAPEVAAEKPAPEVATEKPAPEVAAEKPGPKVTAEKPAPKVTSEKPAAKVTSEKPASKVTPEKPAVVGSASDSPPLANTPSKEEVPAVPAAQSAERRKPVGKLQLCPPSVADPLPTPDSELEDAAALAQSIIAGELMRTPTVTSPEPASVPTSPPAPPRAPMPSRLSVEEPEVPTPPVGAVSLAQIGVKGKSSTAAQIESSLVEKTVPEAPASTAAPPADVPKKKLVKKVVKKEGATGAEAPVPPPRKKEKKPKEK